MANVKISGAPVPFALPTGAALTGTEWVPMDQTVGGVITTIRAQASAIAALASVGFAAPTAQVGLTAIPGVLTTAMRSDAAPALNVGISPTWTGNHTFSPVSGTALTVNGVANSAAVRLVSGSGPTSGVADLIIDRNGSTANAVAEGPNINMVDTATNFQNILQFSGGQTELWQFDGAGFNQVLKVPTVLGMVINAPTAVLNPTLTLNGVNSGSALVVSSVNGAVAQAPDIIVNRTASAANNIQTGPSISMFDTGASTGSTIEHAGGQSELWQFNGSWQQAWKIDTSLNMTVSNGSVIASKSFVSFGTIPLVTSINNVEINGGNSAQIMQINSAGAADTKVWDNFTTGATLQFRCVNDADTIANDWLVVTRTGTTPTSIAFSGTSLTFNGVSVGATTGSFTGTAVGLTSAVTVTCHYTITGTSVTLYIPTISGTSNSTSFSMSGLPAAIQQATAKIAAQCTNLNCVDNTSPVSGFGTVSGGSVIFSKSTFTVASWTNIGPKTWGASTLVYDLN
jgi:hypothetical protein